MLRKHNIATAPLLLRARSPPGYGLARGRRMKAMAFPNACRPSDELPSSLEYAAEAMDDSAFGASPRTADRSAR